MINFAIAVSICAAVYACFLLCCSSCTACLVIWVLTVFHETADKYQSIVILEVVCTLPCQVVLCQREATSG